MSGAVRMTSNRPYLIRAMYAWIGDNGMTPFLLVDAQRPGVRVPAQAVKDGKVVLNIAARAVAQLELGDADITFSARFGGVSRPVRVPVAAVEAIYAHETGQGMMLPADAEDPPEAPPPHGGVPEPAPAGPAKGPAKGPRLRVVK